MARAVSRPGGDEARLWAIAILISLVLNLLFFAWVSIESIKSELERRKKVIAPPTPPEQFVTISPEMLIPVPEEKKPEAKTEKPEIVRTSPDQETAEPPPSSRRFMGERNTRATSNRAPTEGAPDMPSQTGREPRGDEIETTESQYQDGRMGATGKPIPKTEPTPTDPSPPSPTKTAPENAKGEKSPKPGEQEKSFTSIREKILGGPFPVDLPVPKADYMDDIKPREEAIARDGTPDAIAEKKVEEKQQITPTPKPRLPPIDDPAFRGNQSKTAILGNISRTGNSALNVNATPMGKYQAQISRAVELAWQRNCVKHRDFITPGYLTIRFLIQQDGHVKLVESVGQELTGEIQRGFTFAAIREADIPAMPAAVREEMGGDALEIVFRFNF
ncbi:hypothetical protein [Luteolibacter sp. AS25]|uniref:hypothetical protein n=1 Tax=Luteolibacter sp. AS25 TaxID=3135776 RepID=UPI00398AA057